MRISRKLGRKDVNLLDSRRLGKKVWGFFHQGCGDAAG
jgi:hypothetical protein